MQKAARWPAALVVTAFLVLALLSVAAWRLMQQERALDRERIRERLENAASLVVRESERALAQAGSDARTSLSVRWDERGLRRTAGVPLIWSPMPEQEEEAPRQLFASGEELEFAKGQPEQAIVEYGTLLHSPNIAARAGALLRIARCQRTLRRLADALETYNRLAPMHAARAAGAPAELIGHLERAALFDASGNSAAASREREKLKAVLEQGEHQLDRATFEFYAQGLRVSADAAIWAEAVDQLWSGAADTARGATILPVSGRHFVAEWTRDGRRGTGRLVDLQAIHQRLARALHDSSVDWQLTAEGGSRFGGEALAGPMLARKPGETGLPWGVNVALRSQEGSRGPLLVSGLVFLGMAILATLYLAYRAVRRELRVGEMQSEFVSAVSHEFRTPITALTHLTDLLESGETAVDRRPLYYKALARETGRLREMVENLLDFGRIEAGRYKYKPEEVNTADFVRSLVDEFREQPSAAGREMMLDTNGSVMTMAVDPEAMRRAVWNLLDNAAKYSPSGTRIMTRVSAIDGWTAVSVQDEGPGVAREDRKRIYQKFVRGRVKGAEHVKGTGIGLAMVNSIVRSHGGRVELESQPGTGSRFTILLPPDRRR